VDEEKKQSLLHFISKSITPPKFFSAGSVDISKYSYFSHGTPIYALFTEPTQHYASIMVQRQLQAVLKGGK
jgi:exoribonuclease R